MFRCEALCQPSPKLKFVFLSRPVTHPKFNNEFAPEKWWLDDEPFQLGRVTFQGIS